MSHSGIRLSRRKFLLGMGVAALSGAGAYAYLKWRRPVASPEKAATLGSLRDSEPFDVCIIGSGPAGTVLGLDLARKGMRVLILESGMDLQTTFADARMPEVNRTANSGSISYPAESSRVRAFGGTSSVWTGRCDRLHPIDFEVNAYTPKPARWPITYADLQPYYSQAEQTLRVRGGGFSRFNPPRKNDLPLPAESDISGLKKLLERADVIIDDSPTSTSPNGGGPVRVAADLLPEFASHAGAVLIGGGTVSRLLTDANGRVVGAQVNDLDRQTHTMKARAFVIAAGAIETPRLLLLSRSERFPEGLGNGYGQVGRFFSEHPNLSFQGMIKHDWNTLSPDYELARCHQFYDDFKHRGLGSPLLVFTQSWIYPDDLKGWSAEAIKRKTVNLISRTMKAELRIGATLEMEPVAGNRIGLSKQAQDYFGNPVPEIHLDFSERDKKTMSETRALIRNIYGRLGASDVQELDLTWSHHHIGTCRMGDDPRSSVTDANLRVHGCRNLYVLGSASFVTGGASHPTLVIVALAHRLALHLRERFASGEYDTPLKATVG